eukprot:EG_transcript_8797
MSGTRKERNRAGRYLRWLLKQRSGAVRTDDLGISSKLEDVKILDIPQQSVAFVMGPKGSGLRAIEEETNTFLFMARDPDGTDVLVICGGDQNDRRHAEHSIHSAVNDYERSGGRDQDRYSDASWDRRYDSPPRKYARDDQYDRRNDDWDRRSDRYDDYDRHDRRGRRSRSRSYDSRDSRRSQDRYRRRSGSRDRYRY